jgi:hypothetical protein
MPSDNRYKLHRGWDHWMGRIQSGDKSKIQSTISTIHYQTLLIGKDCYELNKVIASRDKTS